MIFRRRGCLLWGSLVSLYGQNSLAPKEISSKSYCCQGGVSSARPVGNTGSVQTEVAVDLSECDGILPKTKVVVRIHIILCVALMTDISGEGTSMFIGFRGLS